MINLKKFQLTVILIILSVFNSYGQQFRVQGSATQTGTGLYRITADATGQAGMVTNYYSLDLLSNFTINFQVNFGTKDDTGADGMAFMMSRSCNPSLTLGGGLGVQGIPNSLIIDFDTYANGLPDDLAADHTGIYANGNMTNSGLIMDGQTSPVCLTDLCPNVEDGQWHTVQVQWEYLSATSQRISLLFDGQLRGTSTRNHIANEFANANIVYWSVAGSTGALSNLQQMRVTDYTNIFTYCEGTAFTLTAPANGTNYNWTGNSSVIHIANYTATTSGTYSCNYTNNCGQPESVSFVINVPVLVIPVLTSNTNVCAGTDAVFTITSVPGYRIRYTLNSGPVQELLIDASGVATLTIPAISADQVLHLTQVFDGTCSRDINLLNTVLVRPIPVVTATGGALCAGTTLQLLGTPSGGTWTGAHISATGIFDAATATPGMYSETYQYTNQWGCSNSSIVQVEVYARPVVQAQNGMVCTGQTVQVLATPTGGSWTGNYISASGLFDATAVLAGLYPVTYSYTDGNNCSNQSLANVVVKPLPVLTLTDTIVCSGSGVQLIASPAGGIWSGSNVSSNGNFDATGLASGLYTVQYMYSDANGCEARGNSNVRVYSDQILPVLTASPAVCEGADASFQLNGIPGSVITYSINGGQPLQLTLDAAGIGNVVINGIISQQQLLISRVESGPCIKNSVLQATVPVKLKQRISISRVICEGESFEGYSTAGTYTDLFTGANGCDSTRILQLFLQQYPKPDLGPDRVFCDGDTIRLSPGIFTSYLWNTGETTPVILINQLGTYTVTTGTVCGVKTDQVDIKPGLCEIYFPSGFTPNGDGRNDQFKPETNLRPLTFTMQVFNRWGQLVFSSSDIRNGWDGTIGGKQVDSGVFVYHASYTVRGIYKSVRGMITLIR